MIRCFSIRSYAFSIGAFATVLALAACSDKDIRVYRAPKDTDAASQPMPEMPASQPQPGNELPRSESEGPALSWRAPTNWHPKAGDAVRRASFAIGVGDAAPEVAITVFPGDAGGVMANVNRWRGQAGLPPIEASAVEAVTTGFDEGRLHFTIVDADGGARRIVAAMASWNGATWFFKLSGESGAVGQAKKDFLSFLRSVRTPPSP